MYKQLALFIALLGISETIFAQTPQQDSLMAYLVKNEGTLKSMVGQYETVTINWKQFLATMAGFFLLAGATWKFFIKDALNTFVKTQTQAAIAEMNDYKNAHILVVSSVAGSANGNDAFLRSYFKEKKFPNVEYLAIDATNMPVAAKPYDLLFINNDDNVIDLNVIRNHYIKERTMIFYFSGITKWELDKSNDSDKAILRRLNFATSRAQIHLNLMSSLEFRDKALPKYDNV